MKRLITISIILFISVSSFSQTSDIVPVDIKAEEETLVKLMDSIDFESMMTEDALICGTDPSEFLTKLEFLESMESFFENPPEIEYFGGKKIKVAPDGNSAIAVSQYIIAWSPKIPWRQVFYFVKINDKWMIHFISISFIPKNEDIQKINEAIE